jgi:hypothetical protein
VLSRRWFLALLGISALPAVAAGRIKGALYPAEDLYPSEHLYPMD